MKPLSQSVSGTVITRADPRYGAARDGLLWNARKPERYPELIVQAHSASDVQAVVRYARARDLGVSVRGGGHNWSGIALQRGIVLDLSALDALTIDTSARIAEAGPGVRNRDLARALGAHGLAFPVGHCASVPLSGYLLGGGLGWNGGDWGVACFSVESLDLVMADGGRRRASATENPELFWAARGGGPDFFGVVTSYRLRLQALPRAITTSVWTYDLADLDAFGRWIAAIAPSLPRNVELTLLISSPPPALAGRVAKVVTAAATVFADTDAEARHALGEIAAQAPAGALAIEPLLATPFDSLFDIIGAFFPAQRRYAADTFWCDARPAAVLARLAEAVREAPSPECFALGLIVPPQESAGRRDAAFSLTGSMFAACYAIWQDPAADHAHLGWLRQNARAMAPLALGHYVGEADLETAGRIPNSFSPAAWAKLKALQRKYDPAGLFRIPATPNESRAA